MYRHFVIGLGFVTVLGGALLLGGCSRGSTTEGSNTSAVDTKAANFTCPMHPEIVQDKAGDCPKCGMKLVEKR